MCRTHLKTAHARSEVLNGASGILSTTENHYELCLCTTVFRKSSQAYNFQKFTFLLIDRHEIIFVYLDILASIFTMRVNWQKKRKKERKLKENWYVRW